MSLKKAAEDLLKIADQIEAQAAEVTQFVCEKCNHTATLANINAKRSAVASEMGQNVAVSPITVNDKVSCPACDGVMSYKANEESEKYYFDEKKAMESPVEEQQEEHEKSETPEEEAKEHEEKEASEPVDYDSLKRYMA